MIKGLVASMVTTGAALVLGTTSCTIFVRFHDPRPPARDGESAWHGGRIYWNYYYSPGIYLGRAVFTPIQMGL